MQLYIKAWKLWIQISRYSYIRASNELKVCPKFYLRSQTLTSGGSYADLILCHHGTTILSPLETCHSYSFWHSGHYQQDVAANTNIQKSVSLRSRHLRSIKMWSSWGGKKPHKPSLLSLTTWIECWYRQNLQSSLGTTNHIIYLLTICSKISVAGEKCKLSYIILFFSLVQIYADNELMGKQ